MSVTFYASFSESRRYPISYLRGVTGPNWANMNARVMIVFLDLDRYEYEDLAGFVPMPEARRAAIKARAQFEKRAPLFEREQFIDGNLTITGLSVENIQERLTDFERFLDAAVKAGAKSIYWA